MEYKKNKNKFPLKFQKEVASKLQERKRKYEADKKNPEINKAVWNAKRRKWTHPFTQIGYIQPTVREVFVDLKDEPSSSSDMKNASKFATRCLEKLEKGEFNIEENCASNRYRVMGAGPKRRAIEVRSALFGFFIDVRDIFKARLPQCIMLSKASQIYEEYCELKKLAGEQPDQLKIQRQWLRDWCKDYKISLRHPNKRFSISQENRKRRIIQFLQNVWRTRHWFQVNHNIDPPILSADQMPLHRNESSNQKSLNFSAIDQSCFVKENHNLSRERATVMTIASSSNTIKKPHLEYVFKGQGKRVKVNPPEKSTVQWSEKGSYRVPHVLKYIE